MTLLSVSGLTERGFNRRPARLEIYGFRTFLFSRPLLPKTGILDRHNFRLARNTLRMTNSLPSIIGLLERFLLACFLPDSRGFTELL